MYDFTRCQRPDGSTYGSRGKCKQGTPVGAPEGKPSREKKAAKPKQPKQPKSARTDKPKVLPNKEAIRGMLQNLNRKGLNPDEKKVFRKILSAQQTKELGQIVRKIENGYMDDSIGKVSIGFIRAAKKQMKDWLEVNQRSGVGAAAEKRKEEMTPEEKRRARTAEAIKRGIKAGVVRAR